MEVLAFFAAKAVVAHFTATVVGGAAATAATAAGAHFIAGEAGTHAAAYLLAHGSSNIAMHVGANAIASTAASVAVAGTALSAAYVIGNGAWSAYSVSKKVEEIRKEANGDDAGSSLQEKGPSKRTSTKSAEDFGKASLTPAGILVFEGSSYNDSVNLLLKNIFATIFQAVDLFVAEMKHKDHKGKLKTELAQVAPCSGCGKCIDFDQRQQGSLLCTCECSFEKHHTLSLMQHFQQGRPGFLILKTIALNIYPQLKRRGRKEGKEIKKKTLRTGNACIECGCGDYAAMYSGASICVCQHDTEEHSASYNDSPTRELDTYLSIIGDRIYMEQRHLRGPDWLKTSLFQIEDSGECQDFEFRRHRTFHTDNSAHDYCRCGGKRYSDHRRILATRLEFIWNTKEREGVKAAYETNW